MATRAPTTDVSLTQTINVDSKSDQIDANWFRWVLASVNTHFQNYKHTYILYLEGDERTTGDEEDYAELRMDGPLIQVPQKGLYWLDYDINILIQSHMNHIQLYNMHIAMGTFAKGMTQDIPVYKYGSGPLDDQTLLGCLKLHHTQRAGNRGIEVNTFGIIHQDTRITQTTLEGHYRLEIVKGDIFNGSN